MIREFAGFGESRGGAREKGGTRVGRFRSIMSTRVTRWNDKEEESGDDWWRGKCVICDEFVFGTRESCKDKAAGLQVLRR